MLAWCSTAPEFLEPSVVSHDMAFDRTWHLVRLTLAIT